MKALSVRQPWASLIVAGVKRVETRSRRTSHRGPLAIHATRLGFDRAFAATFLRDHTELLDIEGVREALTEPPTGAIVGTVNLVLVQPTQSFWRAITETEHQLGNYALGRWGWILSDAKSLPAPIPMVGRLGLWDAPDALLRV